MKIATRWCIPCLFLFAHVDAQTILAVPFICEWANTNGGCPAGNWKQSANCGPTSVLMVASKYDGTHPMASQIDEMDNWLYANYGMAAPPYANPALNNYLGYGTNTLELAALASDLFGFTDSAPYSEWDMSNLQQELNNGYPVIVYVYARMNVASGDAHYMVLLGMDTENVYVNDPGLQNGGQRSATDTTPGRAYPISLFRSAWAANGNAGVAIHPSGPLVQPTWIKKTPTQSPSGRTEFAMAFDPIRGEVVLFGGYINSSSSGILGAPTNETWVWDGTTWSQKFPTTSPPPLRGHQMVFDFATSEVVLFGGFALNAANDTWTWDGANWTQHVPTHSPPARSGHVMGYDSLSHVVVFGGNLNTNGQYLSDTWTWDAVDWTEQFPISSPSERDEAAMTYDSQHKQLILNGGIPPTSGYLLGDTWTWDGTNWTEQSPGSRPPLFGSDFGSPMAFDASLGLTVYYSNDNGNTDNNPSDTWIWNGSIWQETKPGTIPNSIFWPWLVYDSIRRQIVLFGVNVNNFLVPETWTYGVTGTTVQEIVP